MKSLSQDIILNEFNNILNPENLSLRSTFFAFSLQYVTYGKKIMYCRIVLRLLIFQRYMVTMEFFHFPVFIKMTLSVRKRTISCSDSYINGC